MANSLPSADLTARSLAASGGGSLLETKLDPLQTPEQPTQQFAEQLQQTLLVNTWREGAPIAEVLPAAVAHTIITKVLAVVRKEPTLLEISPSQARHKVTVVGDTHGHYQDLCHLFDTFGRPDQERVYIFNGDFVDRGSFGAETLLMLLTYKWLLPEHVYLVRGNHEGAFCTKHYGFKNELISKYGKEAGKGLYKDVIKLFAQLPLAALVEGKTLILHGGLFRVPPEKLKGQKKYKNLEEMPEQSRQALLTGTLDQLRAAGKGGVDPNPDVYLSQLVASDVLWSDPSRLPGQHANDQRGVGTRFGPDVTESFLSHNGVKLIIRSHEGPDARFKRPADDRMPSIDDGFCVDHDTPSGKLVTLFSAPCYPMHQADGEEPFHNKAAVLHLTLPDYSTPDVQQFEAVLPRPPVLPLFYIPSGFSSDSETEETVEESELQAAPSTSTVAASQPASAAACSDTATSSHTAAAAAGHAAGQRQSARLRQAGTAVTMGHGVSSPHIPVATAVFGSVAADSSQPVPVVSGQRQRSPKRQRS